jgi:hypothetical protein
MAARGTRLLRLVAVVALALLVQMERASTVAMVAREIHLQ